MLDAITAGAFGGALTAVIAAWMQATELSESFFDRCVSEARRRGGTAGHTLGIAALWAEGRFEYSLGRLQWVLDKEFKSSRFCRKDRNENRSSRYFLRKYRDERFSLRMYTAIMLLTAVIDSNDLANWQAAVDQVRNIQAKLKDLEFSPGTRGTLVALEIQGAFKDLIERLPLHDQSKQSSAATVVESEVAD